MTKNKYNEMLEELISNLESEIRINNQSYFDNQELNEDITKDSIVYVLGNAGFNVDSYDIELDSDL